MGRQCIKDLKVGEQVTEFYLVKSKRMKETKNRKPFLDLDLVDRTGLINAKVWDQADQFNGQFERGDVVKVKAEVVDFQGSRQLRVQNLRLGIVPDEVRLEDLVRTGGDPEASMAYLRQEIDSIGHPGLAGLLRAFFDDPKLAEAFRRSVAARNVHHVYQGGLLEHTVKVVKITAFAASLYPSVNRDLAVAGAILHDIGKIRELDSGAEVGYTTEGYLLGHIAIGLLMIREKAAQLPELDPATLLELEHLMLSHHGEKEFGSPILPMTAEAMIVNHADNLDAKTEICLAAIAEDPNEGEEFTQYHRLMNRHFFKGIRRDGVKPPAKPKDGK
jgi:3'-5' exoribonuclease